jgi:hypothetical protein
MYIESVPNRGSPPAILLRESFREHGRVRKRTLANLSAWPTALVEGFRTLLKGGVAIAADGIRIRRALPHGHAAAVLGTIRAIGFDRLLGKPADKRLAPLAMALIASRLIAPASKLATARELAAATAASSLGRLLGLGSVAESPKSNSVAAWLSPAVEPWLCGTTIEQSAGDQHNPCLTDNRSSRVMLPRLPSAPFCKTLS